MFQIEGLLINFLNSEVANNCGKQIFSIIYANK